MIEEKLTKVKDMSDPMILAIDHVQLAMPPQQEDRAREYYRDLLGLQEVPKPEALAPRGGCWFQSGRVAVHLGVQEDFVPAKKAHPAFIVSDLDALKERLESAGYEVIVDTSVPGVKRFHTADPFGNRLEFIQEGQSFE